MLVKKLDPNAILPSRSHPNDAGLDLHAIEECVVHSGCSLKVRTGLAIAIPFSWVGFVCPRSGLAAKHSITVLNSPGIIDSGYRGEVCVLLVNLGEKPYRIKAGDRIAQLVVTSAQLPKPICVDKLPNHDGRGKKGFGSSG